MPERASVDAIRRTRTILHQYCISVHTSDLVEGEKGLKKTTFSSYVNYLSVKTSLFGKRALFFRGDVITGYCGRKIRCWGKCGRYLFVEKCQ
jgi:hypothetical protein